MKNFLKGILHAIAPVIVVLLVGSATAFAAGSLTGRPVTDPLQIGTVKAFDTTDLFQMQDKDGNIQFTLDGSLNAIGIGDTTPDAKLKVETSSAAGTALSVLNSADGNGLLVTVGGTTTKPIIKGVNGSAATVFELTGDGGLFSMPQSYNDDSLPTCTTAKTGWQVLSYDTVVPISLEPSLCMCSRNSISGVAEWTTVYSAGGACA
jgi:hypothetical protein